MTVRRPTTKLAFTLVELLVVVAIVAILIAILVPVVSRVRESAAAAKCASNMRQLVQATQSFAAQNDGHGPGGSSNPGTVWNDILNAEVFGRPGNEFGSVRVINPANNPDPAHIKTLTCPKWVVRSTVRVYAINEYVGGPRGEANWVRDDPARHVWAYYSADSLSGLLRSPPAGKQFGDAVPYNDPIAGGANADYSLGPKLSRFAPTQFLYVEHDWSNDFFRPYDTPVIFNRDAANPHPGGPGYADYHSPTKSGDLSFRHPYYGKANFARFDGAVEALGKDDGGQLTVRYAPQ